jgi:hypothetical protein
MALSDLKSAANATDIASKVAQLRMNCNNKYPGDFRRYASVRKKCGHQGDDCSAVATICGRILWLAVDGIAS